MEILTNYKTLQEGQLVKNQGSYAIVRYIMVDPVRVQNTPDKEYALVRITLLNDSFIPYADTSQPYELIELINKPVETTKGQPVCLYIPTVNRYNFNKCIILKNEKGEIIIKSPEHHPEGFMHFEYKGYEYLNYNYSNYVYYRKI